MVIRLGRPPLAVPVQCGGGTTHVKGQPDIARVAQRIGMPPIAHVKVVWWRFVAITRILGVGIGRSQSQQALAFSSLDFVCKFWAGYLVNL